MANELNNLFEAAQSAVTISNRGLTGTAQLTTVASNIAASIIREMNEDVSRYAESIKSSQTDNNSMDALIESFSAYNEADASFIAELDDEVIDGMLKSQQSKRSRCKSKAMTMDNYKSLLTGAIAENLIRRETGKTKNAGGARKASGSIEYTIEELERLNEDQEALRREIRNVQSKKSIMKSKAGFDESDDRWIALCRVEAQLKDMRVSTSGAKVVEVDTTKDALNELLAGQDLESLKAADSKALLAKIASMIGGQTE